MGYFVKANQNTSQVFKISYRGTLVEYGELVTSVRCHSKIFSPEKSMFIIRFDRCFGAAHWGR